MLLARLLSRCGFLRFAVDWWIWLLADTVLDYGDRKEERKRRKFYNIFEYGSLGK